MSEAAVAIRPEAVIAEARCWIGTRFHHQGRLKGGVSGGGCDCLGLLIGVASALQLKSRVRDVSGAQLPLVACDGADYGMIPDSARLLEGLQSHLFWVDGEMGLADVLLMNIDGAPQHLGLASQLQDGAWGVIHAYAGAGKVVEHRLDRGWRRRVTAVFRIADLAGIPVENSAAAG